MSKLDYNLFKAALEEQKTSGVAVVDLSNISSFNTVTSDKYAGLDRYGWWGQIFCLHSHLRPYWYEEYKCDRHETSWDGESRCAASLERA